MLMYEPVAAQSPMVEALGGKTQPTCNFKVGTSWHSSRRKTNTRLLAKEAEVFEGALQFRKLGKYAGIALRTRERQC